MAVDRQARSAACACRHVAGSDELGQPDPDCDECEGSGEPWPARSAATVSPVRIEVAINKIARVQARLVALDHHYKTVNQSRAAFLPSEQRLLQDALDLLNPEVKLA